MQMPGSVLIGDLEWRQRLPSGPAQNEISECRVPRENRAVQVGADDTGREHPVGAVAIACPRDHPAERDGTGAQAGMPTMVLEAGQRLDVTVGAFRDDFAHGASAPRWVCPRWFSKPVRVWTS